MNVTRDVLTDLLPVYFSGEASEDTKRLMEEYFRENPDFERIARKTATALEDLRMTAPVAPEAEREKYDLQWAREELFRRRVGFGVALLFTLAPLMTLYRDGRLVWTAILDDPWMLALCWCIGALCWFNISPASAGEQARWSRAFTSHCCHLYSHSICSYLAGKPA